MKTDSLSFASQVPSLFQIAALFEDFFPNGGWTPAKSSMKHLPVAEFMLNPDKLMTFLRSGKMENSAQRDTNAVARATEKSQSAKRPARYGLPKKPAGGNGEKSTGANSTVIKKVEFTFKSLSATSVKLAGDFTEWEKQAVEMLHAGDGVWCAAVPLAPGSYSYRFIVDGQWFDDPAPIQRIPNPFGSENAVVHVT
jgi:hypothetical protein